MPGFKFISFLVMLWILIQISGFKCLTSGLTDVKIQPDMPAELILQWSMEKKGVKFCPVKMVLLYDYACGNLH